MKKHYYGLVLLLLIFWVMLTGCSSRGYSQKQAKDTMTEYIQKKYGDTPAFEWIRWYKKKGRSQGYYAKTTEGYYIRMNVFVSGSKSKEFDCFDTKEYEEIEEAMELAFSDNPLSDNYYVKINPINEASSDELWDSLNFGFHEKWNGNLQDFLTEHATRYHKEFIYDTNSTTNFYVSIRPDSIADYIKCYEDFEEYVTKLKEINTYMLLSVLVFPPTVPVDALDTVDPVWARQTFLLDILWADTSHQSKKPVLLPSQAEGVECCILQSFTYDEEFIPDEHLAVLTESAPSEPFQYIDVTYKAITPAYRVDNTPDTSMMLLFDFSVILKDYLAKNPGAKLGRDFVLVENPVGESFSTPLTDYYYTGGFDTPEDAERFVVGEGKYIYMYKYYTIPTQIYFAEVVKE